MPKQTFLSLPEDKQEHILNCAIDEFAQRGYEGSSINRIVEAAGIAKGSFYQYFTDKFDLYEHILTVYVSNVKMASIEASQTPQELESLDFFELFRRMFMRNFAGISEDPRIVKISTDLGRNRSSDVYKRIMEPYSEMSNNFFYNFIEAKKRTGEIAEDIDSRLLNYMLLLGVTEYSMRGLEAEDNAIFSSDGIERLIDSLKRILSGGIFT